MRPIRLLILLLLVVIVATACSLAGETGDRNTDATAAQSFVPDLPGYTEHTTDNLRDTLVATLGGASVLSGNPVQALLVAKVDDLVDCYQDVGALEAKIYTQNVDLSEIAIPIGGVLAVVNQDRVRDNFLACLLRPPQMDMFGAQGVEPEPCYGYGTFTVQEETISFLYAATDQPLCNEFSRFYAPYNPVGDSGPIILPQ
jgi:hypothetical protein